MKKRNVFLSAVCVLLLDQLTKAIIRSLLMPGESISLLQFLSLTHVKNYGIGFGLFQGIVPLVIIATVVIIIGLLYYLHEMPDTTMTSTLQLAWGFLLGGSVGNLLDRIFFGAVTDFLDFHIWPVFNIADSAVTLGGLLLLWWLY